MALAEEKNPMQDFLKLCESRAEALLKETNKKPVIAVKRPDMTYGLYGESTSIDGDDALSLEARKIVLEPSLSVVGVSSNHVHNISGIVVKWFGGEKILTSACILGDCTGDAAFAVEVEVLLSQHRKVPGEVIFFDHHHNIVLIHACAPLKPARLREVCPDLGLKVLALGRRGDYKLLVSQGDVNSRHDDLDSDDVLSSTCITDTWSIGGPVIDRSTGDTIGMTLFGAARRDCSPFIPSIMLLKYLEHFSSYRRIIRPWIGLSSRSVDGLKLEELESIFLRFHSANGIIVKKVIKDAPADRAGIAVGDVITHCNGCRVNTPIELSRILFDVAESQGTHTLVAHRESNTPVEVVVQSKSTGTTEVKKLIIQSFSPTEINCYGSVVYMLGLDLGQGRRYNAVYTHYSLRKRLRIS